MGKEKFRGKYRIESSRLKNYDYSQNGAYFVTIVTKNRDHFFGEIVGKAMILNEIGKIVWDEWFLSEKIRTNIFMDKFVIMPNHIHGIVIIDNERNAMDDGTVDTVDGVTVDVADVETLRRNVSTGMATQDNRNFHGKNKFMSKISPQKSSLSHMIREFKSAVTRKSREKTSNFAWQPRFHDRVIRNENELNRIREYIMKNSEMWGRDRNNRGLML